MFCNVKERVNQCKVPEKKQTNSHAVQKSNVDAKPNPEKTLQRQQLDQARMTRKRASENEYETLQRQTTAKPSTYVQKVSFRE